MQKLGYQKPTFGKIFAILFILAAFSPVFAATQIVVNKSVSASGFSKADIRAIFTMQKRFWSNNAQIKVYTLPDSSPLHKSFIKDKLQMFPHQIRKIWDRMTFSGTGMTPIELDSEEEMIDKIATTPNSIGYLDDKPNNENIRVVEFH